MTGREETKLPPTAQLEVEEMADVVCAWCGSDRTIQVGEWAHPYVSPAKDVFWGLLTCGKCGERSVFELTGNNITFAPGKQFLSDVDTPVPESVRELLSEAQRCFYGTAYRSVVAMSRSCIEQALEEKGITGNNLPDAISKAKKAGIVGDDQIVVANGARLLARDALHHMKSVSQTQAMHILAATVDLVNHIAQELAVAP